MQKGSEGSGPFVACELRASALERTQALEVGRSGIKLHLPTAKSLFPHLLDRPREGSVPGGRDEAAWCTVLTHSWCHAGVLRD